MPKDTPAKARFARALSNHERRYERALRSAKRFKKHELEKVAARLLVLAMQESAFSTLIVEIAAAARVDAREKGTESALVKLVLEIIRARRVKGGIAKAAKTASAREAVKAAWEKADKRGRGAKTRFDTEQAAKHKVSPRTIENWRK